MTLSKENRISLIALLALYTIFTVTRLIIFYEQPAMWHVKAGLIGAFIICLMIFFIRVINLQLDKTLPFEKNIPLRIGIQILLTFLAVVAARFIFYPLFADVLHVTIPRELLILSFFLNLLMIATIILAIFGYHFVNRWKQSEIRESELQKEKALVQYDSLRNQLNPHFLFNSLTSLNSLIYENPQLASEFLQQLSKVFRYVLDHKEKNLVSLETEINFVRHYVNLLKTRYESGLDVLFEVSEAGSQKAIVPVTLQILLENAIKHNTTQKSAPLTIRIYDTNDYLIVENNLQKMNSMDISNGYGLENLKNLYRYLSDKETVIEQADKTFTVKIPLLEL